MDKSSLAIIAALNAGVMLGIGMEIGNFFWVGIGISLFVAVIFYYHWFIKPEQKQ